MVRDCAVPENVSELRSFLGLTNSLRKFVQGYAKLGGPLTSLPRKSTSFVWTADCQAAFIDGLALTTARVLVIADYAKPLSCLWFWDFAALLPEGRLIVYLCRKFSPAECNYGVGEQELLVLVHAMRIWRCYAGHYCQRVLITEVCVCYM